jgi:arylsulfatase A-like enzyme
MDGVSLCPSYTPDPPADCRKTKDAYIRHLDEIVAEMIEFISEDGGWDRTLIVIASDHGYHAGCTTAKAKGAKSANYCADHPTPYDCFVYDFAKDRPTEVRSDCARRTTCIISGGALAPALRGSIVEKAEIIDVAPTVADAMGVPFPCEGRSLLSTEKGVRTIFRPR